METLNQSNMVRSLAESYASLRAQREALDEQIKALKEQEEEAKARLINEMSAQQMPSVRFDGLGRFVIKTNTQYSISDDNLFARALLQRMVDNGKAGRPFSDGLMLQRRPAKTVIEELLETGYMSEADLAGMGLAKSSKFDMTFTKAKG